MCICDGRCALQLRHIVRCTFVSHSNLCSFVGWMALAQLVGIGSCKTWRSGHNSNHHPYIDTLAQTYWKVLAFCGNYHAIIVRLANKSNGGVSWFAAKLTKYCLFFHHKCVFLYISSMWTNSIWLKGEKMLSSRSIRHIDLWWSYSCGFDFFFIYYV